MEQAVSVHGGQAGQQIGTEEWALVERRVVVSVAAAGTARAVPSQSTAAPHTGLCSAHEWLTMWPLTSLSATH